MALTGKQYNLKLKATLDAGHLDVALRAKILQLESKGITNIKIRTVMDNKQLKSATLQYKNAQGDMVRENLKFGKSLDKTDLALKRTVATTRGAAKGTNFFTKALGDAALTAIKYSLGLGLIYKAMAQIGEGIQYIKDLDKEMRDIQIVSGYTDEVISSLADNYNELAKAMGATTLEVARGSLEWTRQGKTIEETQELLKSTLMLAKLGNVDTAQATEYLTSILNGFKLEAKDTEGVVSKLVAVDNAAATSVQELATALQKGSVSAQKAGVDLDELIAYVGTVSSVTRQSAERIGTAFRTMFARFQDVKSGALDDTEDSLNNVEAALRRVEAATGKSIPMVNRQTGTFRDFSDVLNDLYEVWDDLNTIEQANISKALAGVRQREVFLTLMENETMMRGLLKESMESEGLAADRYAIYLEGLAAAQNKAKASWEGMWKASLEGDLIKMFYGASAAVLDYIESLGGLDNVIITVAVALGAFALASLGAEGAVIGLMLAWDALTKVMMTNPIGLLLIGLTLLGSAMISLNNRAKDVIDTMGDAWISSANDVSKSTTSTAKVVQEFEKTLRAMNRAYAETPWYVRMFIDTQDLATKGLEEFIPLIAKTTKSIDEYNAGVRELAESAGYSEDAQGRFYRTIVRSGAVIRVYSEDLKLGNDEQQRFIDQNPAMVDGFVKIAYEAHHAAEELEVAGRRLQDVMKIVFYNQDTGDIDEKFRGLYDNISRVNQLYEDGILDSNAYFTQLQESINAVDMSALFSEEDGASKRAFLEGLTENTLVAFDQINEAFTEGESNLTEYTEQLASWGSMMVEVGEVAVDIGIASADALSEFSGIIGQAIGEVTGAMELNAAVEEALYQQVQGNLEFESKAYAERAELLGRLVEQSAYTIKDINGNIITGAKNITAWLMKADGNLAIFSDQVASQTGISINTLVRAVGGMLQDLSKSIGSFKADIEFVPHVSNKGSLLRALQNWANGGGFNLPSFGYTVEASANVTQPAYDGWMAGEGMGRDEGTSGGLLGPIGRLGEILAGLDFGLDWTADMYSDVGEATSAYDNFADSVGSITNAFKDMADSSKAAQTQAKEDAKSLTALLGIVVDKIKQGAKARKTELKEALADYKKLIKTRKDLLKTMRDEEKYQKRLATKQRGLSRVLSEIEELRLDDSEEAAARRRALEEEAAELQDDIAEDQADKSIELQQDALDEEYLAFKENIQAQIDLIDEYLSHPGVIVRDALSMIEAGGDSLYEALIAWNDIYGTGIKNDIVRAWDDALAAMQEYGSALATLDGGSGGIPSFHTGGIVGGGRGGSGEVVAKLLTGELVSTRQDMDNFISNVLPSMLGTAVELSGGAGLNVDTFMELNVNGNLDSSVVPQIDRIAMRAVEKMTEIMQSRGHVRRAQQFQI